MTLSDIDDPLIIQEMLWPDVTFYDKQIEIIYSVRDSMETYVPAGNKLGKDFVCGFIVPSFFLFPQVYFDPEYVAAIESTRSTTNPYPHTVRIITTSVRDDHLIVLWGEIGRFIETAKYKLEATKGGPLIVNHRHLRKLNGSKQNKQECKISYVKGIVSERGEGLAGHHAAYTLFIADEASGVDDIAYNMAQGWAKRMLYIGNPNECQNIFRKAVTEGDILKPRS